LDEGTRIDVTIFDFKKNIYLHTPSMSLWHAQGEIYLHILIKTISVTVGEENREAALKNAAHVRRQCESC
jgi:hypothetical protein